MTRVAESTPAPDDGTSADVAAAVADGRPVDWAAVGERAAAGGAAERLENLRIIDAIAALHRAGDPRFEQAVHVGPPQPPAEGEGEPWGRYRLLQCVGSGSFGSVYRAWDPQLEREIAIKILHRHVTDEELKRRLLLEGRALAKLSHDNVVTVYGVESHEGRIGLCMKFVAGETLEAATRDGRRLSAREAIVVGQDVCRALAAVHEAGFIHRDVTARNIMRDIDGRIVLMDFGTGLRATHRDADGTVRMAGTPMYMAPEIFAGQAPSKLSDVYSVGVLLYYLVTGKFPVEATTLDDLRLAHMAGRRTPLHERAPDLPASFVRAVDRALAPDPQQRCASVGALLQDLDLVFARKPRSIVDRALLAVEAVVAAVASCIALGAITSRYFNKTLARAEFANESVVNWLTMGATALVAPVLMFVFVLLAAGLVTVVVRLLLDVSPAARRSHSRVMSAIRRCRLDDLSTLSACALLLSVLALVVTWAYFVPFLSALVSIEDISSTPAAALAFLSPANREYHYLYRKAFTALVLVCIGLWYAPWWLARRRGESINRMIVAGGIAVFVIAVLFLDFPYRMLVGHKRDFEAVSWQGERCFMLGTRRTEALLYCPEAPVPRNRIVRADDAGLKRLGIEQDIFTNAERLK